MTVKELHSLLTTAIANGQEDLPICTIRKGYSHRQLLSFPQEANSIGTQSGKAGIAPLRNEKTKTAYLIE